MFIHKYIVCKRRPFIIINILLDFMPFSNFNKLQLQLLSFICHLSPSLPQLLFIPRQYTQQAHIQPQTQQLTQSQTQLTR